MPELGGTRVCIHCRRPLSMENFKPGGGTRVCLVHAKALRLGYVLGTMRKRAFNCIRLRARHDRFAFGQERIRLPIEEALAYLTESQVQDYGRWSLVPLHPEKMLEGGNAMLVTNYQRRYLMCQWNMGKSLEAYKAHLTFLMGNPDHVPDDT
jgi:hypothetical protein